MAAQTRDYEAWHAGYDDPASSLSWRLRTVQGHIEAFLDARAGPVRAISACAGDGRDVLGVLARRSDAATVRATLLEIHPGIAERARQAAREARRSEQVEVRSVDAGHSDAYLGLVPADLVLLVGIFGNISDADLARTVAASPQLCAPGGLLLWSRGRNLDGRPDVTGAVRSWFATAGFAEQAFTSLDTSSRPAVGVVRYDGPPQSLVAGQRWFTFER
jgi:hypothetical protein